MRFTRRQFLKTGSATVATLSSPHVLLQAFGPRTARASGPADPIVVILQWEGGNDGLNTVIPVAPDVLSTDPRVLYEGFRPVIGIPASELAATELGQDTAGTTLALHPVMTDLHSLFAASKVAVINGVGYPNQSLSHFRSEEIWFSGEVSDPPPRGWFGSYLDQFPLGGDPQNTLVRAASVDRNITPVFDTSVASVIGFREIDDFELPDDPIGQYQDLAARQVSWTNIYSEEAGRTGVVGGVGQAANNVISMFERLNQVETSPNWGSNLHDTEPNMDFSLAGSLYEVASIIRHDLLAAPADDTGLRFFHVRIGGFDTHSRQEEDPLNRETNRHGRLLYRSSLAIKAFYDDMQTLGIGSRMLLMTFSEFGRRPEDNAGTAANAGTDHGAASPLFMVGESVNGGIYGTLPALDNLDEDDNLQFGIDFRDCYATVMEKWLGLTNAEANAVIPNSNPGDWNPIPGVLP
jgi:uncharacterized protein (DUF1501 family)